MTTSTQRQRGDLPRLNIPPPIPTSIAMQQPAMFERGQPLYSPALPTSIQQSFHPPIPIPHPGVMQTPMQPFFNPAQMAPPGAPGRPGHRVGQQSMNVNMPSVAQLAAAGIHPPSGFPITPLAGHFSRQSIAGFPGGPPPSHHPFPNRNRRQLSIGGPPKAVLGGPQRKLSPIPPASANNAPSATGSGTSTPVVGTSAAATTVAPVKPKKIVVNLPKETIPSEEEGKEATKAEWARVPLKPEDVRKEVEIRAPEVSTMEEYPPEEWRRDIPSTVDVFLPGKVAWQNMKQALIEEKLEKLGVERGGSGGSSVFPQIPQIHGPHGRAASISSPADPALLYFKLNKLQQSQLNSSSLNPSVAASSTGNSNSTSPQPHNLNSLFTTGVLPGFSPSPTNAAHIPRFITNRHGHSLSLAHPPSAGLGNIEYFRTPSTGATSNPFGPGAVLGSDQTQSSVGEKTPGMRDSASPAPGMAGATGDEGSEASIHAPQGRKPVIMSTLVSNDGLAPPLSAVSRPDSKPDFIRGFGLDIPEEADEEGLEEEEEEEEDMKVPNWGQYKERVEEPSDEDASVKAELEGDDEGDKTEAEDERENGLLTASQSRHHSRHASRLSAALSLRSFGGLVADGLNELASSGDLALGTLGTGRADIALNVPLPGKGGNELEEGMEEWTGSEDVDGYLVVDGDGDEASDDESIGEWSNPSDEERARQARVEARMRRRTMTAASEQPRKLPPFPRPPDTTIVVPHLRQPQDDDIISNPSEEERGGYLGLENLRYPPSGNTGSGARPLPPLPVHHSRGPSSHSGTHSLHDPARAHSRVPSDTAANSNAMHQSSKSSANLNPNAKPFVFGMSRDTSLSSSGFAFSGVAPNAPLLTHSRLPSQNAGTKKLNAAAAEFTPGGGFMFGAPFPAPSVAANLVPAVFPTPNPPFPVPQLQIEARPLPVPPVGVPGGVGGLGGYVVNTEGGSPFKVQGREKRRRRDSSPTPSTGEVVEDDSMASFRFPSNFGSPASMMRDGFGATSSPRRDRHGHGPSSLTSGGKRSLSLNPDAEPFTFAGFSHAVGTLPHIGAAGEEEEKTLLQARENDQDEDEDEIDPAEEDKENNANLGLGNGDMFAIPSTSRTKRAPIPLDFKHPVSNNTVPAGLFKALVNNGHSSSNSADERTRRAVRSRLSSREFQRDRDRDFYELGHSLRPSLDDLGVDMPAISHKVSRPRLVTDPGRVLSTAVSPSEDVFAAASTKQAHAHARRRSSLPDNIENMRYGSETPDSMESVSETSSLAGPVAKDLTMRLEMRRYEERLENLLEEKIAMLRRDLRESVANTSIQQQGLTPKAEEMISDVVSLFRSQLAESAVRGLEDSQIDARGELDFELIRDVVEQGHAKMLQLMKSELSMFQAQNQLRTTPAGEGSASQQPDLSHAFEHYSARTINAVMEALSELSARLETIARGAPGREQDQMVDAIVSSLGPLLTSQRSESVDYDYLTNKLSQAVKPHISQIIDLASDKRETAGLIIDRLLPVLLPVLQQGPAFDADAVALQLTTEVRRAIAPIDAFEIKEQVADLVVERLDSRLAVRDKSFNVETVTSRVTDSVAQLLNPLDNVSIALSNIMEGQRSLAAQQSDLSSAHQHVVEVMTGLPTKVLSAVDSINVARPVQDKPKDALPDPHILEVRRVLDDVVSAQHTLTGNSTEVVELCKELLAKLTVLPDPISAATNVLQNAHADLLLSRDHTKHEIDDLRRANTDLQVQLAKARGAHGQVRVEKDMLNEKLNIVEADRERVKAQVKELQAAIDAKAVEVSLIEAKNSNLEEGLANALVRLQTSDVATQANKERIAELEKANADLLGERQSLKAKVDSLDLKLTFATRDEEHAKHALQSLQKQYDYLASQQEHWDKLRHTSEQIEQLTSLIGQSDNEELKELRRVRDRAMVLEGEHAALQKRFKEQENRSVANEKAANSAKQSLAQAQSRASEWEKRAQEFEARLERTTTQLEQAEQTYTQLETDHSVAKMQLEEREANERLTKDREVRLREEITALETKARHLQDELEKAKAVKAASVLRGGYTNGSAYSVHRPESRASTVYGNRSATPNGRAVSDRSITPPNANTSVWDSMHAPSSQSHSSVQQRSYPNISSSNYTPQNRYPPTLGRGTPSRSTYSRQSMASPTPSTVSLAPTVDAEGWWS